MDIKFYKLYLFSNFCLFVWRPNPEVFRDYSWHLEITPIRFGDPYRIHKIEPWLAMCKASTQPTVLWIQPPCLHLLEKLKLTAYIFK